jgi:hypothetical protein
VKGFDLKIAAVPTRSLDGNGDELVKHVDPEMLAVPLKGADESFTGISVNVALLSVAAAESA